VAGIKDGERDCQLVCLPQVGTECRRNAIKKTPIKSPNLQACIERMIQVFEYEVLNGFCVNNQRHRDYIPKIEAEWYDRCHGHSRRGHLPPV